MDNCFQIAFDLKITKLEGSIWNRQNMQELAEQLYCEQGKPRFSIENRITIAFDESTTSSVAFFEKYKPLLLYRLITECYKPEHWVWVAKYKVWHCVIVIPKIETVQAEKYQHSLGWGLREEKKADFEYDLLKEVAECTNGIMTVNPNKKEHGIDGWVWLPEKLLEKNK